jgi:hypothetical protein
MVMSQTRARASLFGSLNADGFWPGLQDRLQIWFVASHQQTNVWASFRCCNLHSGMRTAGSRQAGNSVKSSLRASFPARLVAATVSNRTVEHSIGLFRPAR